MDIQMETNKWLWQPKKSGPISLRVTYRDLDGTPKTFTRSLKTNHLPTARKIRDAEFAPIIFKMEDAQAKLDLIHAL